MRPIHSLPWVLFTLWATTPARAAPEMVQAFAFGARILACPTSSEPGTNYAIVFHGTPAELEYSAARGWGYEVTQPGDTSRGGYGRFGPFDDSPNLRDAFADSCPTELYDSFIGAKEFSSACTGVDPCSPPEGIVFRIDVPNGAYRFVAAVGDAQFPHTHRIVVENGGSGAPQNIGPDHVVLVHNYDQNVHGAGVFARVGFDGKQPPDGSGLAFVNMDAAGMETAGPPDSPTLEVTEGYIRVHQLQAGASGAEPNGADLVLLELWRDDGTFTPIRRGSTWRYLPGLSEASSPETAWRTTAFDDSGWATGPAPFGYGEPGIATDLGLLAPPMQNNYTSLFLRQSFDVADPAAVTQLEALVDYDDGFVLWINGVEVLRINVNGLDGDPIFFDDTATSSHESGLFESYPLPDPSGYLLAGTNVAAVQVFNNTIGSSDLKLDLELFDPAAPDLAAPTVDQVVPSPGITVRTLTEVQVTFDEVVSGIDAQDLLIDGAPATGLSGSGRGPFVFTFPEPLPGVVDIAWAAGHGITDQASPPNPFAGGGWNYALDPDAPLANVVINEFLALNRAGLVDEDAETSDWLEIHNAGSTAVDLTGWSLTDEADNPGKWVFPARSLDPSQYLVVFASGKDRGPADGELHTGFRLSARGEYLALYNGESPRELIHDFAPRYPRQRADYSYGLDGVGAAVYFQTPTPGAANAGSVTFDGFVLEPRFTPERGFYDQALQVTLTALNPGATIRYTLDGSEPSPTAGNFYLGSINVEGTSAKAVTTIRAIAYADGMLPSDVVTHSYIFTEEVRNQPPDPAGFPSSWGSQPADYEMDARVVNDPGHEQLVRAGLRSLPTLSIVMDVDDLFGSSAGFYANPSRSGVAWERPCSAELIQPDGGRGFQVNCGIRAQGGSSVNNWKVIKISMRLLFKGDYGPTTLRFPFFPDSDVEEFNTLVLDAHMNQTWQHPNHSQRVRGDYIRDVFMSDLQNAMGGYAPRDVWVNLYLNGLYWGIYDVHERPDAFWASSYFRGAEEEYDALKHNGSTVVDGDTSAWNAMISLASQNLSSNSNYQNLQSMLDMPLFIDYMIVNFFGGNDDWDHHNWYATRRRISGWPWLFHSWDAEHSLKSITIDRTGLNNSNQPSGIYTRLLSNDEFKLLFADHVHRHFFNGGVCYVDPSDPSWDALSPERNRPADLYMARVDEIDTAIACEAARWGDTRRPSQPYTRNNEWQTEIDWLITQYFEQRSGNVLNQFRARGLYPSVGAPLFSRNGGRVAPGFQVTMASPSGTSGTIYYTTDGSDPRVFATGAVSSSATPYSSPLTINELTPVKARILEGGTWSALNEAVFTLDAPGDVLRITEIMYNPPGGAQFEFIELQNTGSTTVDLSGLFFSSGIDFVFPSGESLGPSDYLVLVPVGNLFASAYPGVPTRGEYFGQLSNGGEKVTLKDADGNTIVSVDYDDEGFWQIAPDGLGRSLVIVDPLGDPDDPLNWRASADLNGAPGAPDPPPPHDGVVMNEVLARSGPPLEDAVELHNFTLSPLDIGGWYLSDSRADETSLRKFRIPDGTILPAGGYGVIYENEFSSGPQGFSLGDVGGEVYLSAADAAGNLTGYVVGAAFGVEDSGVSFGRHAVSTGFEFTALGARTFGVDSPGSVEEFRAGTGADNASPKFGPVVINEVMYHPAGGEEFVELYNSSADPVPLHDAVSGRGWRLEGVFGPLGTSPFEFGSGDQIPDRGYLLVVGIDPEVFRSLHAVPASTPVVGPYSGGLDNGGERIELLRPDAPVGAQVPYVLVDHVRYNDKDPWPAAADGSGPSLERVSPSLYGNDPLHWAGSGRLGGTPGVINTADSCAGELEPPAVECLTPTLSSVIAGCQGTVPDVTGSVVASDNCTALGGLVFTQTPAAGTLAATGTHTIRVNVRDEAGNTGTCSVTWLVEDRGFIRGNVNNRAAHALDISDLVDLLNYLFGGFVLGFDCEAASDVNNDGAHNIVDIVALSQGIFRPLAYSIPPPTAMGPAVVAPDGGSLPSVLGCNEGESCP